MEGHLLHIQVYSPGRKDYSRLGYPRSRSVDEPSPSEKELLDRIKKAVASSSVTRTKPQKDANRKTLPAKPHKPFLQTARHSTLLVEFSPKDHTPSFQPIQLLSRKRKSPPIRLPLI